MQASVQARYVLELAHISAELKCIREIKVSMESGKQTQPF